MSVANKYVVGLTGGIGSGKSAAADIFRSLGVHVVNADDLSREAVEPGQPALGAIAAHFGEDILSSDGSLNRVALRTVVFLDLEQKSWLEALLHPLIADLIRARLAETESPYSVLESPLLFETDQHRLVDRVLVVDVSVETQLERAMARDGSEPAVIRSIIASQIERAERTSRADDVVNNEGSMELLRNKIEALHRKYQGIATQQ